MVPSLTLLSCESSVSVKKTLIEKKKKIIRLIIVKMLIKMKTDHIDSMYIVLTLDI